MEMLETARMASVQMDMAHVKRDFNKLADDLTNDITGFFSSDHKITTLEDSWHILDLVMKMYVKDKRDVD